jgi:hypothetical protein
MDEARAEITANEQGAKIVKVKKEEKFKNASAAD